MKKTATTILVLIICMASVFADGWIGLGSGVDFGWIFKDDDTRSSSNMSIPVSVMGAYYFNDTIGLAFDAGMNIPMLEKEGEAPYEEVRNKDYSFVSSIAFMMKGDLSDTLLVEGGLGLGFECLLDRMESLSTFSSILSAQGRLGVGVVLGEHFTLRLGAIADLPFLLNATLTGENAEGALATISKFKLFGAGVHAYLGLGYAY